MVAGPPPIEACFRVNFAEWLAGLSAKQRRIAELLAEGHTTVGWRSCWG